jgi:hypothetical protein
MYLSFIQMVIPARIWKYGLDVTWEIDGGIV